MTFPRHYRCHWLAGQLGSTLEAQSAQPAQSASGFQPQRAAAERWDDGCRSFFVEDLCRFLGIEAVEPQKRLFFSSKEFLNTAGGVGTKNGFGICSEKLHVLWRVMGVVCGISHAVSQQNATLSTILQERAGSIISELAWFPAVKQTWKQNSHLFLEGWAGYASATGGFSRSLFYLWNAEKKKQAWCPIANWTKPSLSTVASFSACNCILFLSIVLDSFTASIWPKVWLQHPRSPCARSTEAKWPTCHPLRTLTDTTLNRSEFMKRRPG